MNWEISELNRQPLRHLAVVVPQDAAKPLATFDRADRLANLRARVDQLVVESLAIGEATAAWLWHPPRPS